MTKIFSSTVSIRTQKEPCAADARITQTRVARGTEKAPETTQHKTHSWSTQFDYDPRLFRTSVVVTSMPLHSSRRRSPRSEACDSAASAHHTPDSRAAASARLKVRGSRARRDVRRSWRGVLAVALRRCAAQTVIFDGLQEALRWVVGNI